MVKHTEQELHAIPRCMCFPQTIKCTACLGFSHPAHIQLEVSRTETGSCEAVLSSKAYEAGASPDPVKKDRVSLFSHFGIKISDQHVEVVEGQRRRHLE